MRSRWNNRTIDRALRQLGESYDLPPEQFALFVSRVRRDVEARFGPAVWKVQFATPEPVGIRGFVARARARTRATVAALHSTMDAVASIGGLTLRPAFAFAGILLAVSALLSLSASRDGATVARAPEPQTSSAVATAAPPPVTPGSGFALSVFGGDVAVAPPAAVTVPVASPRRAAPPVPAARARNVFSADEQMTKDRPGKNVFRDAERQRAEEWKSVFSG